MARVPRVLAAVLGVRHPRAMRPAEAWRVPVPSPRFRCPVHDTAWNGPGGCFMCEPSPQPSPSQQEEP